MPACWVSAPTGQDPKVPALHSLLFALESVMTVERRIEVVELASSRPVKGFLLVHVFSRLLVLTAEWDALK